MIKKYSKLMVAYLPTFSFTMAYLLAQYLISNGSKIVSPLQAIRSVIFFYLILFIFGFIIHLIVKDHIKAGLVLWITAELFLFSQKYFVISGIIAVVLILIWAGVTRLRKKPLLLNYVSFLLSVLGFALIIIIMGYAHTPLSLYFNGTPQIAEPSKSELVVSKSSPDIYYVVLDAYSRTDVLEELFGFDNSEFTDYLNDKGFIIPTDNHSNYGTSELSEVATLNIQYVQNLMPDAEGWPHWWLLSPLIEKNTVKTILEDVGYKSISIDVDYEVINDENVDTYFKLLPIRLNTFEKYLIQTSPIKILSPIISKYTLLNTYSSHRDMINFAFSKLSEIPELDGPKFIYSHILSPHPPFVFDKYGQPVEPSYEYSFRDGKDYLETKEQYKIGYIGQLEYINQQLKNTINSILEKSETPPIIIIMGDHGSRLYTDFSEPENTCISEVFSNFMAFHLPGIKPDEIPSDITSVNVFRLIFDHYFQTEFGLLDNRYYFFSYEGILYRFKDVGQSINLECEFMP